MPNRGSVILSPCGESGERGREYLPCLIAIKSNTFSIEVLRASFFPSLFDPKTDIDDIIRSLLASTTRFVMKITIVHPSMDGFTMLHP